MPRKVAPSRMLESGMTWGEYCFLGNKVHGMPMSLTGDLGQAF
jgi:hypothetical protein